MGQVTGGSRKREGWGDGEWNQARSSARPPWCSAPTPCVWWRCLQQLLQPGSHQLPCCHEPGTSSSTWGCHAPSAWLRSSYVPHHGPHGPADAPSNGHEAPRTGALPIPGSSADGCPCKSPWRPLDSYTATSLLGYEQGKHWKNTSILEFKPWQKPFFLRFWFIITLNGFCYHLVSFCFVCNDMKRISCLF